MKHVVCVVLIRDDSNCPMSAAPIPLNELPSALVDLVKQLTVEQLSHCKQGRVELLCVDCLEDGVAVLGVSRPLFFSDFGYIADGVMSSNSDHIMQSLSAHIVPLLREEELDGIADFYEEVYDVKVSDVSLNGSDD